MSKSLAKLSESVYFEHPVAYHSSYNRPEWAEGLPETVAKPRHFNCPKCGQVVRVLPQPENEIWHWRGICPDCKQTWSNIRYRFVRPKPKPATGFLTDPDFDTRNASSDP